MKKRPMNRSWIGREEKPLTAAQLKKITGGMLKDIKGAERVIVRELHKRGAAADDLRLY